VDFEGPEFSGLELGVGESETNWEEAGVDLVFKIDLERLRLGCMVLN
jgi:hypothetical protein